jgi:D-alanine-D-alanine ligase
MKVAVLFTTNTDLRGAYKKDWQGRDLNDHAFSVMKALASLGHKPLEYHANMNLFKRIKSEKHKIDLVFNLVDDGFFSKSKLEPHVPAILDLLGIRYTGSNYVGLSLSANKARAKKLMQYHKIPTPKFQVFEKADEKICDLRFPLIVKPVEEDSSVGIRSDSVVKNKTDLRNKIRIIIRDYKQAALVEEFIEGREFNVGVLGDKKKLVLPISEISFEGFPKDKPQIINYDAKWNKDTIEYKTTNRKFPELTETLKNKLIDYSMKAGECLLCRDYYRVDFRVDARGRPYVLEANPNPDISEDAGLAGMATKAGMTYAQMIDYIIRSARRRKPAIEA